MKPTVPQVILRYAKQIGLPEKDAEQVYLAWVDTLTFAQIYEKLDQAKASMKEDLDEAKKTNPHKEYKGAIHNDVKVSLGDATVRQLEDSKKWYTNKIKEYKSEPFFRDFLLHIQPKLNLINAELAGRIGLKESEDVAAKIRSLEIQLNSEWKKIKDASYKRNNPNTRVAAAKAQATAERKYDKISKEIESLKKLLEDTPIDEALRDAGYDKVFASGEAAGLSISEISSLFKQALRNFNNREKAIDALVSTFVAIKKSKKDISKFTRDFSSLYNVMNESGEEIYTVKQTRSVRMSASSAEPYFVKEFDILIGRKVIGAIYTNGLAKSMHGVAHNTSIPDLDKYGDFTNPQAALQKFISSPAGKRWQLKAMKNNKAREKYWNDIGAL